jgi:hypothetical protein
MIAVGVEKSEDFTCGQFTLAGVDRNHCTQRNLLLRLSTHRKLPEHDNTSQSSRISAQPPRHWCAINAIRQLETALDRAEAHQS